MIQMNVFTKQKRATDIENKLIVIKEQRGSENGEGVWEWRIQTTTRKINRVPLDRTGNNTQHVAINCKGKNLKRNIYESLCCTPEIIQHCKSTILVTKKKKSSARDSLSAKTKGQNKKRDLSTS